MTEPRPAPALDLCRELLASIERAESWPMAVWLCPHPLGGTVKHAFAEAAALLTALDESPASATAIGPRDDLTALDRPAGRDRRPALVLTRELREYLTRITRNLEAHPEEAAAVLGTLTRVNQRLSPAQLRDRPTRC